MFTSVSTTWGAPLDASVARILYEDCISKARPMCAEIPNFDMFDPEVYSIDSISSLMSHILHYNLCTVQQYRTLRLFCSQTVDLFENLYALLVHILNRDRQENIEALCVVCWLCCSHGVMLEFLQSISAFRARFSSEEHTLPDWAQILHEYVRFDVKEDEDTFYTEANANGYPIEFLNLYKDERDLTKILDGVFAVLPPGPRALFERAYSKL